MFKKESFTIVIFLFLFVFQPPLLPVSLIYLLGPVFLIGVLKKKNSCVAVLRQSQIQQMSRFFLIMTGYLVFVNCIDIIIDGTKQVTGTRLRCLNQLFFLTIFQFSFITYLLKKYKENNYGFEDSLNLLVKIGLLQGICAVVAFLIPPVRSLFLIFGDQALSSNEFFMERRGYGFSMTLIDTFGYGLGLIAGYILLYKWKRGNNLYLVISLLFILFAIAVNARTGILVFFVAIALQLLYGASIGKFLLRLFMFGIVVIVVIKFLPPILEKGTTSDSPTISWISLSFYSIFEVFGSNSSNVDIEDLDFLSSFVKMPTNPLEFIFGAGHYVYDTKQVLGFRTDIGYLNLFWEFGVVGSFIMLTMMFCFMIKPFFITKNNSLKKIAMFNTIVYFMLLMKAILIGFNPGVFVNYLVTFSLYYYISEEKRKNMNFIQKT